ncbi:uncharacterized protein FA14DRAFT_160882 [Meira miltonrushii]|uniref:Uncharacterized protein n=1 Tax=Meira miltonrushii TaxID=1280837 RepID=A0A316VIS8_9BASI|nr:uncharacterized protein FA14DRAFT_160882 [Meira miltonrushii]PWN35921.1 hypothetical protein FA14DRAFT_160882 [Meira miltonrushii]
MSYSPSLNAGWTLTGKDIDGIKTSSHNHHQQQSEQASPSEDTFSTPDLGSGSGSSNGTPSPFTPTRNPYTSLRAYNSGKSPKIEGVMAARDRPVFKQEQHGRSISTSSSESGSSGSLTSKAARSARNNGPPPSAARRQLMPTIPTRKTSSNTLGSNSGKDSASTTPQQSPNLGNQTNIQSLAQAIAARAQHVAAAKAALRQQEHQKAKEEPLQDSSNVYATNETASGLQPPLGPHDRGSIVSVATAASDYGDAESDAENTEDVPLKRTRTDRADVVQSFRWSQGDWADYAAALSDQIDVGATPTDQDHQPHEGTLVAAPTLDTIASSRSITQTAPLSGLGIGGAELPATASVVATPQSVSGGSGDALTPKGVPSPANSEGILNNPLFAQFQSKSPNAFTTSQSLGVLPSATGFPTTPSMDSIPSAATTPDGKPVSKRKARPIPLSLHNISTSTSSPAMRSPSASRSLASPSMGGRTPPPTMPPTEPLPPLPEQSTILQKIWSAESNPSISNANNKLQNIVVDDIEALSSPRRFIGDDDNRSPKRSSDPSDQMSQFMRLKEEGQGMANGEHIPRNNSMRVVSNSSSLTDDVQPDPKTSFASSISMPAITPARLSATSVALVRANQESTRAGTDYAQAILDQVQREPTYDELQKRGTEVKTSTADKAHVANSETEEEEDLKEGSEDEEEEEAEEAVVTRVTTTVKGARASLSRAPSMVRRDSANSITNSLRTTGSAAAASAALTQRRGSSEPEQITPPIQPQGQQSNSTSPGANNIVTRMRAMIEARNGVTPSSSQISTPKLIATSPSTETLTMNDGEEKKDDERPKTLAERRRPSAGGPPSAWTGTVSTAANGTSSRPSVNMATQPQTVSITNPPSMKIDIKDVPANSASASVVNTPSVASVRSPSATSVQGQTGTWTPTALDTPISIGGGAGILGGYENPNAPLTNSNGYQAQRTHSGLQSRRSEMGEGSDSPIERIKRTEDRFVGAFGEIALAFKQLQAEKRTLEKIIRATTPLDGLGNNGESLAEYLTVMSAKLDVSTNEIKKLLDLLDQQRSVMDYMVDTHKLEMESHQAEMEDLKDDFDAVCEEADTHRDNAIQLTEELDKAHHNAILARAETLRYKTQHDEAVSRKDKSIRLLQKAREDISRLKGEKGKELEGSSSNDQSVGEFSTDIGSVDDISDATRPESRIAALEKELAEVKALNAQLQSGERKDSSERESPPSRSIISPAQMSEMEDIERERDALREKSFQQEKDISELRAQIALSGGHSTDDKLINSLPAAREDQVRLLMQQMSEQRSREAQIRKAYRQLRDDLRKMQNVQQHDRKRTQAGYSLLSTNPTYVSATQTINPAVSSIDSSNLRSDGTLDTSLESGPTPRHLKRLSLPIANKMVPPPLSSPGLKDGAQSTLGHGMNDEASNFKQARPMSTVTGGGMAPIFSSNRRSSRTFSVDFSSGVLPVSSARRGNAGGGGILRNAETASNAGSEQSTDESPRMKAHRKLFGENSQRESLENTHTVGDSGSHQSTQQTVQDEEEKLEILQTPRQNSVRVAGS